MLYSAKVIKQTDTRSYVGQTSNTFKLRHANHKSSFNSKKEKLKHSTTLSSYVHKLKQQGEDYSIEWSILNSIPSLKPGSSRCNLCIAEVYAIIFKENLSNLNKKSELFNPCFHRARHKLNSA